jgi:hypothetical protein
VAVELVHERLAEAHDLVVGFSFRIEIRAALGASDPEPRERVLEDLLEAEKLHDPRVHARMEPQPALVRAQRRVELYTVPLVDLNLAAIVHPRHAEHDLPLGLDDPRNDVVPAVDGPRIQQRTQRHEYLFAGLIELVLRGARSPQIVDRFGYVRHKACSMGGVRLGRD